MLKEIFWVFGSSCPKMSLVNQVGLEDHLAAPFQSFLDLWDETTAEKVEVEDDVVSFSLNLKGVEISQVGMEGDPIFFGQCLGFLQADG